MKIQEGDTIYVLKETIDYKRYQLKIVVEEISFEPVGTKTKNKYYKGHYPDEPMSKDGSFHAAYVGGKLRPVVRKTPYPDIPVITSFGQYISFVGR
jgi:hypothetical protein